MVISNLPLSLPFILIISESFSSSFSQQFRDEISTYSFAAALAHNPGSSENVLDPSSLHQTELLLHAEPALELFHIFFVGLTKHYESLLFFIFFSLSQ